LSTIKIPEGKIFDKEEEKEKFKYTLVMILNEEFAKVNNN
jgi:hypothetical protein